MKKISKKIMEENHSYIFSTLFIIIGIMIAIFFVVALAYRVSSNHKFIVQLDKNNIEIFANKEAAFDNKISNVSATKKVITANTNAKLVVVRVTVNNHTFTAKTNETTHSGSPIIINSSDKDFELDLSDMENGQDVLIELNYSNEDSFVGQKLKDSGNRYYFALSVENDNPTISTNELITLPDAKIFFGEDMFPTYSTKTEAQSNIAKNSKEFTISTFLAQNLTIYAEPNNTTARIWIKICMEDENNVNEEGIRLNKDNDWKGTLNLSRHYGHQITLMVKCEDIMAKNNSYSFVSFFVPEI